MKIQLVDGAEQITLMSDLKRYDVFIIAPEKDLYFMCINETGKNAVVLGDYIYDTCLYSIPDDTQVWIAKAELIINKVKFYEQ